MWHASLPGPRVYSSLLCTKEPQRPRDDLELRGELAGHLAVALNRNRRGRANRHSTGAQRRNLGMAQVATEDRERQIDEKLQAADVADDDHVEQAVDQTGPRGDAEHPRVA